MYFIGTDDQPLDTLDTATCEKRILMYDHKEEDYFLEWSHAWNTITTPMYTVLLGDAVFKIPSSLYIVCGDAGGSTDIIIFEEIIGRDISVITVGGGWRKAEWHIPRILDVCDGKTLYPMANRLIPLFDSSLSSIILTGGSDRLGGKVLEYEEFIV